jgi:F0F1-type ATP synthase delta subunit
MRKKLMKNLIIASFNKDAHLDGTLVATIASHLTRKQLKEYLNALKRYEKKRKLIVDCSFVPTKEQEEMVRKQFPKKQVRFHTDPELLFGVRITDNDIVYDVNLKRTLELLEEYIDKQYD